MGLVGEKEEEEVVVVEERERWTAMVVKISVGMDSSETWSSLFEVDMV